MRCPKCGAENPDGAEFCSLCMERLSEGTAAADRGTGRAAQGHYVAPSEWRGDAEVLRPKLSPVVEKKVSRFRLKLLIYGIAITAVVIWLALSLTVWSNPSPGVVCERLLEAANRKDAAAFVELFTPGDRASGEDMYQNVSMYLGGTGRYSGISVRADKLSPYNARCYLEGGRVETSSGSAFEITPESYLIISLENRDGRWYVTAFGTDILP